ncbi:hypothetical protein E4U56_005455 [Claviceps arundinis]|uniref:Uncharacterized protein n=1 Tax=Claviceps arundinis TaxID=1623583 RepID=A0A9P7SQH6_9HYPO|nr:hypothetical protein E4U56_005455 [Claviceps arundinis]
MARRNTSPTQDDAGQEEPDTARPYRNSDQNMLSDERPSMVALPTLLLHMCDKESMQVSSGLCWYLWVDAFDTSSAIRPTVI